MQSNNLCKNFSSKNIFVSLMSNMFYRFIEHTSITRCFQVFHVFENCWRKTSPKSNYSSFTMTKNRSNTRLLYQHWYIKYQFGHFWPIFRLMTSPRVVKMFKFWDSGFKNEYFTSKFPSPFIFLSLRNQRFPV